MSTRIFLVDDHEVIRRGIVSLLRAEPDLEVVGEAACGDDALCAAEAARPDVAVVDLRLPDCDGVQLCRELRSRLPGVRCLILTSFADHEAMAGAVMAGAAGFVLKDVVAVELVEAIRTVGAGGSLIAPNTSAALLAQWQRQQETADPLERLTDRERVILELIGEGLTNRQIAEHLFLAEKTVRNHVSRLLAKLAIQRRAQAAALAARLRRHERERPPYD
jgi:two-component system, NarL family, response regulator DevR